MFIVGAASLLPLLDEERASRCLEYTDFFEGRRDALRKCRSSHRRAELICGALIISRLRPYSHVGIEASGKPVFTDGMAYLSLGHTADIVAAVVSDKPVGLDIELSDRNCPGVRDRYFKNAEGTFAEVFTAYESYGKYTGRGIPSAFSETVPPGLSITHFSPLPGYTAAVCSEYQFVPKVVIYDFSDL